jgi:formate/nitrite transporter FocA (FNT family)
MGEAEQGPRVALDALLPSEMAQRTEDLGVGKAAMDSGRLVALATLVGAFIALGGIMSTIALAGSADAPWGATRVLTGVVFSLGRTAAMFRTWAVVYAGNFAGALGVAVLALAGRLYEGGAGAVGVAALGIATAKPRLAFISAIALGVLCNVLVCLAVWLSYSARSTPVAAFVAAGFEHSVANMYFVPFALLLGDLDPGFLAAHAIEPRGLTWGAFFLNNLLPVTLGNIIGGTLLVGTTYWFVYLRPAARAGRERAASVMRG